MPYQALQPQAVSAICRPLSAPTTASVTVYRVLNAANWPTRVNSLILLDSLYKGQNIKQNETGRIIHLISAVYSATSATARLPHARHGNVINQAFFDGHVAGVNPQETRHQS